MAVLTDAQKLRLTHGQLLYSLAGQQLSSFERDTLRDVHRRWLAFGARATTTPEEFEVVERAVSAMETWLRTHFADLAEPAPARADETIGWAA